MWLLFCRHLQRRHVTVYQAYMKEKLSTRKVDDNASTVQMSMSEFTTQPDLEPAPATTSTCRQSKISEVLQWLWCPVCYALSPDIQLFNAAKQVWWKEEKADCIPWRKIPCCSDKMHGVIGVHTHFLVLPYILLTMAFHNHGCWHFAHFQDHIQAVALLTSYSRL